MTNKLLFLDIDGVCHPLSAYSKNTSFLEYVPIISKAIGNIPVVVSSSWRGTYFQEELQEMLQPLNVIGSTPIETNDGDLGSRQREIQNWLEGDVSGQEWDWVALDDVASLFYNDCSRLILCDGEEGCAEGSEAYKKLEEWVNAESNASKCCNGLQQDHMAEVCLTQA